MESITLGGGCFWCIEAALQELTGVQSAVSGYAGGKTSDPTYEEVCSGETGHAEVVRIRFDPEIISLQKLLTAFFEIHNPTTKNREGPDIGPQYRSIILYEEQRQKEVIERVINDVEEGLEGSVVTEVKPLEQFYRAEDHHQDYFEKNPNQPYCRMNIPPKLEKVREKFSTKS